MIEACGIYEIVNGLTGQRYIGRSVEMRARILQHLSCLRRHTHSNLHLQRSFDKYGEAAFTGRMILVCRREDLPMYESACVTGYRSAESDFGFNMMPASPENMTHSADAKRRIGAASSKNWRGIPKSQAQKDKISATLTGRVGPNLGRTFGPDVRAKQSFAKIGNSNASGHTVTRECRDGISRKMKILWQDPLYRSTMLASRSRTSQITIGG